MLAFGPPWERLGQQLRDVANVEPAPSLRLLGFQAALLEGNRLGVALGTAVDGGLVDTCAAQEKINARTDVPKKCKVHVPTWLEAVVTTALERYFPAAPREGDPLAGPAEDLIGGFAADFTHAAGRRRRFCRPFQER